MTAVKFKEYSLWCVYVFLVLLKAHFISSISSNFDYSELVMLK